MLTIGNYLFISDPFITQYTRKISITGGNAFNWDTMRHLCIAHLRTIMRLSEISHSQENKTRISRYKYC